MSAPKYLVVMGVSGCGKSTVAAALAQLLGWPFIEGDALHSGANIQKMAAGVALTDADRWPWLQAVAAVIARWRGDGVSGVITCSALKRAYRDVVRDGGDDVWFVYLHGDKAVMQRRMAERQGHFMPASLLDSQFAALEEPGPDEPAITVAADGDLARLVRLVAARIGAPG